MPPSLKIIVANPAIPPHVQQTVIAYDEAGYLSLFFTSFVEHPDYRLSRLLKKISVLKKDLDRRSFHFLPINKLVLLSLPELIRTFSARKLNPLVTDFIWEWSELKFDRWVSRKLGGCHVSAVHTYEHAALATLTKARKLNIFSVHEQPSQHHTFFDKIARQQLAIYPELKSAATELLINKKAQKRNKRRDKELELASLIICNSTFTRRTLIDGGVEASKISVIPLSFPPVIADKKPIKKNSPMIFLYAGNQSIRKASHILYEAWRRCAFKDEDAELWLVGKMLLPGSLRENLPGKVVIKDNIPHGDLMKLYQQVDVFVLPSLADGFGMVVTEAMSQNVPVIASENCCGPDIITHMKDGWIVPAGEPQMLANQLIWCLNHKTEVATAGENARQKALSWQWSDYRRRLAEVVLEQWKKFQTAKASA